MDRISFLSGVAVGAGAMYILDPERGTRRRALARDRMVHGLHVSKDFLGKAGRDLQHRARGVVAEARHGILGDGTTDDVLVERVRARLGRYTSHPRAIEVTAEDGRVVLRGPILSEEVPGLMRAIGSLHGVRSVENQLEPHERSENVPQLQGGSRPPGEPAEWAQRNWTPGLQLLAGTAAAVALVIGVRALAARRASGDGWFEDEASDLETEFEFSRSPS